MKAIQQRTAIFIVLVVAVIVTLSVTLSMNKKDSETLKKEHSETDNAVEFSTNGGEGTVQGSDEASLLKIIDAWLEQNDLNLYGDALGTIYMGGTPLFDESTGESVSRFSYLMEKFPDQPWI
jgi:hypothetical protein